MPKLLTIVIPVYNTEQYLKRCLDSLIIAEHLDILDIVVVIDGSPDNSLVIAQMYEQKYPQIFRVIDKPNGGHGSAVKRGMAEAKGKYFRILDSDDWFDTLEFSKYISTLQTLDVDMVLTPFSQEFVYKNASKEIGYQCVEYGKVYDAYSFDYDKHPNLTSLACMTCSMTVIKKSNIENLLADGFYNDLQYIYFVMPAVTNFVFLNSCVYKYFIGSPTQSTSEAGFLKNYKQHTKVAWGCAKFYVNHLNDIDGPKKKWLKDKLSRVLIHNYTILMLLPISQAKAEVTNWDKAIFDLSPELYAQQKDSIIIRFYRKTPFITLLCLKCYRKLKTFVKKY